MTPQVLALATARVRWPRLPGGVVAVLSAVFVTLSAVRGAGWTVMRTPGTVSELMLANSIGLDAWGILLVAAATLWWAAAISRVHLLVWAGHALMCSVYVGIFLTTVPAVLIYAGGIQHLVPPLGAVLWHGVVAGLMRPLPHPRRTSSD